MPASGSLQVGLGMALAFRRTTLPGTAGATSLLPWGRMRIDQGSFVIGEVSSAMAVACQGGRPPRRRISPIPTRYGS